MLFSSVNLEEFDEWQHDPHFIPDLVKCLDNVLSYFIENAPRELWKLRIVQCKKEVLVWAQWAFMHIFNATTYRLKV
jgi:hypothetical protein